ncbi:hypothetical protein C7W93_15310 [Glaciimonas sp. PCH181]|nr:hypothetical protein C7W93_15310 [Glaciimonas sp. PCH181]
MNGNISKKLYARFVLWLIRPALDEHGPVMTRDIVRVTKAQIRQDDSPHFRSLALGQVLDLSAPGASELPTPATRGEGPATTSPGER